MNTLTSGSKFNTRILFTLLVMFLFSISPLYAQDDSLERLFDYETASDADTEQLEQLEQMRQRPLDINTAKRAELAQIPDLTASIITAILHYRQSNGWYEKKADLLQIPGLTKEIYEKIAPFLTARKKKSDKQNVTGQLRFRYAASDSNPEQFDSFYKLYQRARVSYGEWLNLGLIVEKDPGEKQFDDFRAWYAQLKPTDRSFNIIAGNYRVAVGQGLLFAPSAGVFKGGEVVTTARRGTGLIRPFTSATESGAFFGVAGEGQIGQVTTLVFVSKANLDAPHKAGNPDTVLSIDESGLHRTDTEKSKADQLAETLYGGHARLHFGQAHSIGVTYYQSKYDKVIYPDWDSRSFYRFRGDELACWSADLDLHFGLTHVFGEMAQSVNHGRGWLMGAALDFKQFEISTVWREYDPDFYAQHSYGFADSKGSDENERGQYTGIRWALPNRMKLWAYFDFYRHPFRRYLTPIPDDGQEYYTQLEIPTSKGLSWTARFRSKTNLDSFQGSLWLPTTKRNYRLQLDWTPQPAYRLRARYEHAQVVGDDNGVDASGDALYGDFLIEPHPNLKLQGRLIFYDTESSQAPIYVFENDLPGVLKNSYLAGEGRRWYLLGQLSLSKKAVFSTKIAQKTVYTTVDALNIPASRRATVTEWGCQLDLTR